MKFLDYVVIGIFFGLMILIGFYSSRKVKNSNDFFVAGGKVPWWLAGISHNVSGYSGVVFVAFAGVAYSYGFTIYVWWAVAISIAVVCGAYLIAPRWSRLRQNLNIGSPTEYLQLRYSVATQLITALSGTLLKLFDVAAKWASIGILLNVFTGLPVMAGAVMTAAIALVYTTIGGLWADLYTDFVQFLIQIVAGILMFVTVVTKLGGAGSILGMWHRLPKGHGSPFNGPYTFAFFFAYMLMAAFSYNGGTWSLATRYIASPDSGSARKSGLLSGALYLVWPLILFFPMWAAPLFMPHLADPTDSYALMVRKFLPEGLVGLVLAGIFSATLSMVTSDANTISAVITKDIIPFISKRFRGMDPRKELRLARTTTFTFVFMTLIITSFYKDFGGVIGLIITWFGALVGPTAVPMILGLIPSFKHSGSKAAIASIVTGVLTFIVMKAVGYDASQAVILALPTLLSMIVFLGMGFADRNGKVPENVERLLSELSLANVNGKSLLGQVNSSVIEKTQSADSSFGGKQRVR